MQCSFAKSLISIQSRLYWYLQVYHKLLKAMDPRHYDWQITGTGAAVGCRKHICCLNEGQESVGGGAVFVVVV